MSKHHEVFPAHAGMAREAGHDLSQHDRVPRLSGDWGTLAGALFLENNTIIWYQNSMKAKHRKTLALIFKRPVSGNISWADIEALFIALGGDVSEREGSRIGVFLFNEVKVFHRPHPQPTTDKGAVASVRKWLESNGVKP